jgi:hypothetical protein
MAVNRKLRRPCVKVKSAVRNERFLKKDQSANEECAEHTC